MSFTPINTQEEFDSRVKELYGDVGNLQQQITTLTGERDTHANTIAELQKQVKGYETSALRQRIAREKGIPAEMADRLSGETEKDIKVDEVRELRNRSFIKPSEAPHKVFVICGADRMNPSMARKQS